MSNKIAIVTDSTTYLPQECLKQYHVSVIPLSVIWGEQVLLDGVDIQPDEFYTPLAESKTMPTTSQATPVVILKTFQSLLELAGKQFEPVETLISPLNPAIGTHAGPGTVALNFMCGIT